MLLLQGRSIPFKLHPVLTERCALRGGVSNNSTLRRLRRNHFHYYHNYTHPPTSSRNFRRSSNEQRRTLARTSQTIAEPNLSPEGKAKTFLMDSLHHEAKIAQGVIDALTRSGLSGTSLLATVYTMAGRWEVGEDAGLEALVEAVTLDLAKQEGKRNITLWCVPSNAWKSSEQDGPDFSDIQETPDEKSNTRSRAFKVEAMTGLSLTDVAKFGDGEGAAELGACLECACAGIMACSTCHVVVDPDWFDKVGEPSQAEQDMLDLAYAPRATSRLGCQIKLDESMDGMVIRLPRGANNLMDDIPFEDR
jgi:ferredoxin